MEVRGDAAPKVACLDNLLRREEERFELGDRSAEVTEGNAVGRLELEHALDDGVRPVGYGKHPLEVVGFLKPPGKAAVVGRGDGPWLAAGDHVDQDDTQGPDIGEASAVGLPICQMPNDLCGRIVGQHCKKMRTRGNKIYRDSCKSLYHSRVRS